LGYQDLSSNKSGNRFYISYSGTAPSGGDCTTLANDIAGAWNTWLAGNVNSNFALEEVDVIDIATRSGASSTISTFHAGTRTPADMLIAAAMNVEFGIARRYRGGKPRIYLPPGGGGDLVDNAHWSSTFVANTNTNVAGFFSAIEALTVGAMGTLQHVNLSYFHGFTNETDSSGRAEAVPTYKATATHDNVTSYIAKALVSTQRRRRTATTH